MNLMPRPPYCLDSYVMPSPISLSFFPLRFQKQTLLFFAFDRYDLGLDNLPGLDILSALTGRTKQKQQQSRAGDLYRHIFREDNLLLALKLF